jgi:hypothetical protein
MTNNRAAVTMNIFRKLNLAEIRLATISILVGFSLLETAPAQTITPLYGANLGMYYGGVVAQVNSATVPGFVVTAACSPDFNLEMAVWQDTGSSVVETGSYNASPSTCDGPIALATLFNTSSKGYTTVVTATLSGGDVLTIAAWQVGPGGSIAPLGAPAIVNGDVDVFDVTAIGSGAGPGFSMVVTSAVLYSGSTTVRQLTTWNVPANGNITQLYSSSPSASYLSTAITHLNATQAVTADLIYPSEDLAVTAWAIDSAGHITEKGVLTAGYAFGTVIAPYFQLSTPGVITGFVTSSAELEFITWGVSSSGDVTRSATLNKGATTSPPAITYIPAFCLTFADVLGGNDVLDGMVFEQPSSSIEEIADYHTSWQYAPQGAAPVSSNRVVTLTENGNECEAGACPLELEVWSYAN